MRKIDVQITKGAIETFAVEMKADGGLPNVTATIALFTEDDKKITSFSISTESWRGNKFDVPLEIVEPIKAITEALEFIAIAKCNSALARLEYKGEIKP
jgi:hypothetical protein